MMTNKTPNPFVGLKPYNENDSEIFFGREQEIENVLEILQRNKLVTISGASGSGKTSLIRAGLIQRLKKGFVGQSGKDWSIAYFRPGIEPLLNLSHALSANGVLKIDSKSNTTDRKYYSEIISNYDSLGIVEIFKRSEIYNKKNLLIIVDQLEDLYKYQKYFDYSIREEDNTLMNLIYRSVTFKNTAIYFLITIQTPYLTKLTSYSKLQEIISDSQYSIQNLDQRGIQQILDNTFYNQNIRFSSSALDVMIETLKEEIGYLPNFQLLLYRLYDEFIVKGNEKSLITENDIKNLGEISQSISMHLESIYNDSSEKDKNEMASIFKAIFNPQNTNIQYENIQSISDITNIPIKDLSRILNFYKKTFFELFEVFEPVITGMSTTKDKPLNRNSILVLKYFDFVNWQQHVKWKKQEEKDFEDFNLFFEDAIKKNKGEVDYLKTPELENAIEWRDNPIHDKNWATKYDFNFDQTIDFINKSEQDDLRLKKEKSDKLARENKNKRIIRNGLLTISVIISILLVYALYERKEAQEQRKIAYGERKKAEDSFVKAQNNFLEAQKQKKEAEDQKKKAEDQKKKAEDLKKIADRERKDADKQREKAEKKEKEALEQQQNAKISAEIARKAEDDANKESEKNKTLKELIELKNDFNQLKTKLKTAAQEQNDQKINVLIDSSIAKQKQFNRLKEHDLIDAEEVGGDEGMLKLNQQILMAITGKNSYAQTSMSLAKSNDNSIRSFDVFNDQKIAYAGDRGVIKFYDINKESHDEISIVINRNNDIDDRIRNLIYVDKNNLLVTTFSGKIFKVNPEKNKDQDPIPIYTTEGYDIVDFFVDPIHNKQYLVTTNKVITFDKYKMIKENVQYNNIKASFFTDSKLFIVSNDLVYVIDQEDQYYQIRLDGDSENLNSLNLIYVSKNFLFLGDKNGNVLWYDYNYDDIKNLVEQRYNDKFIDHFASITKIFFDEENKLLFTASLDNKIFRYNLDYEKNLVLNSTTNLEGHEKWIWDMHTYTNNENKKILITADENGNLMTWYVHPKDLLEKIELLHNKKSSTK